MKKLLLLGLAIAALTSVAATCVIRNASVTSIGGDAHYAAEMDNETEADILNHRFRVAFIEDGQVVANVVVDGCLRSLQSGSSNFFSADSNEDEDNVDTAVSRLEGPFSFGEVANGNLTITDVEVTRDGDLLRVTGTITNDDNDDLEDVRACAVVYNEDGQIIVVQRDNDSPDLDEDQNYGFSIDVTVPDDADEVDHVSVWADALNGNQPTQPEGSEDHDVDVCTTPTATPTGTLTPATSTPTATNTSTAVTPTNTPIPDAC